MSPVPMLLYFFATFYVMRQLLEVTCPNCGNKPFDRGYKSAIFGRLQLPGKLCAYCGQVFFKNR